MPTKSDKIWENFLSLSSTVIKKSKYGTAMDSILILIALVSVPCLIIFAISQFWPVLIISLLPIVQFIRVYDYFMKNDKSMLRSEKHEETMFRIASTLGQKGNEIPEKELDALPSTKDSEADNTISPQLILTAERKDEHV